MLEPWRLRVKLIVCIYTGGKGAWKKSRTGILFGANWLRSREKAAKAKDASQVEKHLKSTGKWALDVALTVGVPVAVSALKKALGLG